MLGRPLICSAALVLLLVPCVFGQDEFNDEIRGLLDEGVKLYRQGKIAEAYGKFETAFQKQPSSDLVYAFVKRVGEDVVAEMMNNADERIRGVGYRLLELSKPGEAIRKGKKEVQRYLEDLQSKDFATRELAFHHLKQFGAWGARFEVPMLGNELNDDYRSQIIRLLTEIGTEVTLAVAEGLDSDSILMRQNAAIILGNIKDERALPALKRAVEDANEAPEVKKFATEAMVKITRKTPGEWKKAADYYYELAENFYYGHPGVIHAWNRANLIWAWDKERKLLTEREVPRFAFNEQLAEECLYDLMAIDPNYIHPATKGSLWGLLACVHLQQAHEAESALYAAEQAVKVGEAGLLPDHVETLKKLVSNYDRHNVIAKVPGRGYLYEALARSLKEGNALVAASAIETIQEMARPEDLPPAFEPEVETADRVADAIGYPLIEALTSEDKRVRYAAAEAMAKINPQEKKLGLELVIPNLIDALGEEGVRVVLLIYDVQDEKDHNVVNGLKKLLATVNVFPVIARSGSEGILKAKQFPTEDAIFIQKKIAPQIYFRETDVRTPVVETVFDTLRDDVRTRNIPRILLCEDEQELADAKQQFDQTAQGFILRTASKFDLQALFDKLFDAPEAKKDAKDRADRIARRAAETLAAIQPMTTLYPYRDAVDALIKTLNPEIMRDDSIRIAAIRALGNYGDQRALDVLAKILNDRAEGDAERTAAQKPVRMAAARALSSIYKATGAEPTKEAYEILKKFLLDGDLDIELLCAEALGNAKLANEQRVELQRLRRINDKRETRTPDDE